MSQNELSSLIWKACDDYLRGLFHQYQFGETILPFVVLRRLDCLLEPKKTEVVSLYETLIKDIEDPSTIIKRKIGLPFYNRSKYSLATLPDSDLRLNLQDYLNGFSDNVSQILENFQLEKQIDKLAKNHKLYGFIRIFAEVDLHPDLVDNHMMGGIFEELLRRFSEMSNETSGEHYTPRDYVQLLVSSFLLKTMIP